MPCRPTQCFEDVWTRTGAVFSYMYGLPTILCRKKACILPCGAVLASTGKMAKHQVLPGKCNTKMVSWASSSPVPPCTTDQTAIPKPVYGIRTVPAYIIKFPSPYKITGTRTVPAQNLTDCDSVVKEHAENP